MSSAATLRTRDWLTQNFLETACPRKPTPHQCFEILSLTPGAIVRFTHMPADFCFSIACEQAFKEWCCNIDAELTVKKITVQSVDMFGPRVGFVKFKGDVTDDSGRNIPAIVFMRGASVGMLVVITCVDDGQKPRSWKRSAVSRCWRKT